MRWKQSGRYWTKHTNWVSKGSWERGGGDKEGESSGKDAEDAIDVNWTVIQQTLLETFYTLRTVHVCRSTTAVSRHLLLYWTATLSEKTETGWLYLENGSEQYTSLESLCTANKGEAPLLNQRVIPGKETIHSAGIFSPRRVLCAWALDKRSWRCRSWFLSSWEPLFSPFETYFIVQDWAVAKHTMANFHTLFKNKTLTIWTFSYTWIYE